MIASSIVYGTSKSELGLVASGLFFIAILACPLLVMWKAYRHLSPRARGITNGILFLLFIFVGTIGAPGMYAASLFFAVIALAASIDLVHLSIPHKVFGVAGAIVSLSIIVDLITPAFLEVIP